MATPFFTLRGVSNPNPPAPSNPTESNIKMWETEVKKRKAKYEKLKNTEVPIYVQMRCRDSSEKYHDSIGKKIRPIHWSFKDQRAKSSYPGAAMLNDQLDERQRQLEAALVTLKAEQSPITPATVKEVLSREAKQAAKERQEKDSRLDFFPFLDDFISRCEDGIITNKEGDPLAKTTVNGYKTTRGHLQEFCKKKKRTITFDAIDKELHQEFAAFMRNNPYYVAKRDENGKVIKQNRKPVMEKIERSKNSIVTQLKNLKHFLVVAEDDKRCHFKFEAIKHFSPGSEEETESCFPPTEDQIMRMWELDIEQALTLEEEKKQDLVTYNEEDSKEEEQKRKKRIQSAAARLKRVRDRFICNCFIGLRISDLKRVRKRTHITELNGTYYVKIRDVKNWSKSGAHQIPILNEIAVQILEEYDFELPVISDQKMNDYIKEVAKLAGLNEQVTITRTRGGKKVEEVFKMWEIISTHFARKYWATSMVAAGVDRALVKELGAWKSWTAFDRYVKLTPEQRAQLAQRQMMQATNMKVVHTTKQLTEKTA